MLIVTAQTQPQLNSKVGFDIKMTLFHPPPPHKLNVNNISAVYRKVCRININNNKTKINNNNNNNMNNSNTYNNNNKSKISSITEPFLTTL